jgi:2-C-methyl-D-erythritol 2,4-cyclodiphosphate synthase/2-C-methyl-D-erythritol 4-phosphate cytidylyltransferase
MTATPRRYALIAAAGSSVRFGGGLPKQYAPVAGVPLLAQTIAALNRSIVLEAIVVVLAPGDKHYAERIGSIAGVVPVYEGGVTRGESVRNGLAVIGKRAAAEDWVLVHDAARPCLPRRDFDNLVRDCQGDAIGGILALPAMRSSAPRSAPVRAASTEPRRAVVRADAADVPLRDSQPRAAAGRCRATARRGAGGRGAGRQAAPGTRQPRQHQSHLSRRHRAGRGNSGRPRKDGLIIATVRVGTGFDVHALAPGRRLVLGGVTIPFDRGLAGHSDADVLLHAVCDAMLGACGLGDIGMHFPDTDAAYKDADSRVLLRRVWQLAAGRGFELGNIDATIVAQAPKLAPYLAAMATNIAADLGCATGSINVKAKTSEGLGFTGRGEGIAAMVSLVLFAKS